MPNKKNNKKYARDIVLLAEDNYMSRSVVGNMLVCQLC